MPLTPFVVTLPLWTPSVIGLGDVGYLDKPSGKFVTLFNAYDPIKSSNGAVNLPSLFGYGRVNIGIQRQDKRSAALRGLDVLAGLLQFRTYSYVVDVFLSYSAYSHRILAGKTSVADIRTNYVTGTRLPAYVLRDLHIGTSPT